MAVFAYKARGLRGAPSAGTVIADTPRQARDQLREHGLTVVDVSPAKATKKSGLGMWSNYKDRAEVAGFIRRLGTLLKTGIPLVAALETMTEQHHGQLKVVIQKLTDQASAGVSLAEAMRAEPDYFDELSVSIVQVGESTGGLDNALKRLADFKQKAHRLRSRIVSALIYPAAVCVIGLTVTIFLMTYVVPSLLGTLVQSGRPLPALTQGVKAVSDFLTRWWWLLGAAAAGAIVFVRTLAGTERGQRAMDRLFLGTPVLGDLVRKEITSRIAVVMAALLKSGVQFIEAVQITRRTIRNAVFRKALEDYEAAVTAGGDVSGPLKASGVFSPMVVQMLAIGQQSGELEEMLEQMAEAYDQEVDVATQRFVSLLEPMLIILLAVMVGFIAFATILPILEASNVM